MININIFELPYLLNLNTVYNNKILHYFFNNIYQKINSF